MLFKVDDPKDSYYGRRLKRLDVFIAIAEHYKTTGKGLLASEIGAAEEELQELVDKGMVYYNSKAEGTDYELFPTVPMEEEFRKMPLLFGLPEEVPQAPTGTRSNPDLAPEHRLSDKWLHMDSAETIEKMHEYIKRTPAFIEMMKFVGIEDE